MSGTFKGVIHMKEKVLSKKKNGMAALVGILLLFVVSVAGIVFGSILIAGSCWCSRRLYSAAGSKC